MYGAERVVDVDVAELGELPGEGLVVLLLLLVEAQVLEQAELPGAQIVHDLLGRVADAVVGQEHLVAGELGEAGAARLER